MISFLACRITRPGRAIRAKRTALRRLLTHCPPNTSRFIAELRIEGQHRYGPPCGVGSEQPRREPARSQVTPRMDLLAFTADPLPVTTGSSQLPEGLGCITNPETLCQAPPASLITGKGSSSCSSIPGRGCSLSGSLIAMNRYSGFFLL